MDIANNGLV